MFDNLIVSKPKKKGLKQTLPGYMLSISFHAAAIAGAVAGTLKAREVIQEKQMDTTMVFINPDEPKPEEPPPPQLATLEPPPKGFQTLAAPINIPTEIPPINLNERFDPRDYSGVGVEGGVATGVVGGTGPVDLNQVFQEAIVDEVPERLAGPQPVFPALLKDAGIEGTVIFEMIIDTTGHPENGTFRVIESNNEAFTRAAREAVLKTVYRPGRMRGYPVRVLVRQPVAFTLNKR